MSLQLSVYINYSFPHIRECRYPPILYPYSYKTENIDTPDIWIPLSDLQANIRIL